MNEQNERRRPRAIPLGNAAGTDGAPQPTHDPAPTADPAGFETPERTVLRPETVRRPTAVDPGSIRFEEDAFEREVAEQLPPASEALAHRGSRWPAIAISALLGLLGIAFGLWIESLIARLFTLAPWAGFIGLALASLFIAALLVIAIRELLGIRRLGTRAELRLRAEAARASNDDGDARKIASELASAFADRPETARGRAMLEASERDVMDARDRLALVERHLLLPLDAEAKAVVLRGAKRVSLVTAVAPRAFLDIAYVVIENARTVRTVANIYGIRPGRLGFLRLFRDVIGHLAVTGAIAVGDSVLGEAFGHGIASKLSTRLGEGVVNGLLTTRIGISAMDLCRPLPFHAVDRPTIGDISRELVRPAAKDRSPERVR